MVGAGGFAPRGARGLEETGEFSNLMEFCEGEPYARDLERVAARGALDDADRVRASALADYLAAIRT